MNKNCKGDYNHENFRKYTLDNMWWLYQLAFMDHYRMFVVHNNRWNSCWIAMLQDRSNFTHAFWRNSTQSTFRITQMYH